MQTAFSSIFVLLFTLVVVTGCASPPVRQMTREEKIQKEIRIGAALSLQFEGEIKIVNDTKVSDYLTQVTRELAAQSPDLKDRLISVHIINLPTKEARQIKWSSYSLPPLRLYLSYSYLKVVDYENELAAWIALELGNVLQRNLISHLARSAKPVTDEASPEVRPEAGVDYLEKLPDQVTFFGKNSVFSYDQEELVKALEHGMGLLYGAGYDPRGMVSLLTHYIENPNEAPVSSEDAGVLLESARRIIALHSPLRNPIVRSRRFLESSKRMKRL